MLYRVATHELGGIHLLSDMRTKYTISDLYDMIEVMDAHDTYKESARKRAIEENKNNK
jgi:hypothetical protein